MPPPPKRKKLTEVERRVLEKNLTIGEASDEAMKHPAGQRAVALNGGATTYTPAQRDAITNFMESLPAYANPNTEKNLRYSRSQFVLFLSMMEVLPRNAPVTAAWDKAIVEKWTAPFMFWRICVGKRREKQNKEHSNTEAAVAGDDAASDDDGEPEDHYEDDQLEEDDSDEIEGVDEHELLNNILYPVSPAESAEQDELCESIFVKHGQEVTREERVLTTTVYGWLDAHMANVITLAHDSENPDDTTVGARLWARIRFAVRKRVHTLIRRFKLRKPCGVEARPRLDSLELDLLIFAALTKTRAFSRPHYAQIVTGILTSYFGAFRPSSLVGTHDEARKISEMMCWGDIDFLRDSHGLFSSRITIRGFKGHENEHAMEVSTTFEPVERAEDLLFDPTLWYICVGLSRGIFEKYTTIDELIADESCVKLKVKSSHLDKAVYLKGRNSRDGSQRHTFVASEPATGLTLAAGLRHLCRTAGLRPLEWTAIRRATAQYWKRTSMDGHEISVLMNHKVFEVIDTYYASAWERNSLVNIRLGQSGLAQNIRFDLDNVKKAIEASEDQITPALESIIFELQEAKQRGENLDDKTKHFLKAAQTQVASLALGRANVTKNKRGPARDLNVPLDLHNVSPAEVEAAKTIVRDRGRLTGQLVARVHSGLDRSGAMSAENTVGSTKPAPGVAKRHANVAGIAQRDEALGGEDEDEDEDEDNILEDEAGNENRSAGGNEASGLKQLEHDAQVFASKIAAWEAMGKPQKPNEPKTSSEFNEHAFKELVYTSSSADEIVRPQMTAGNPTAAVDIPKLRAQRNNVLIFIMHTMFELAGKELPDYLEAFWTEYMALGHCCPLCIDFTHILPGETESASKHTDKNWHHVATHIKCHSEWHDLELKMRTPDPNIFACPACGDFFTSVISTRSHCISLCPEKAYFTAMRKASEGSYSLPSKARKAPIPSFDEITERQKTHAHKVRSSKYLARALRDPALSVIHDQIESLAEGLETTQLEDLAFV